MLDSLANINLSPQTSISGRSVYSNEANTLSPFSTRSSPWMCTSIQSRSHRLPPYGQSPREGGRMYREHVPDIPEVVEEPGTLSSLGLMGMHDFASDPSESSTSTVRAESPPSPFIPSPYVPSPYVPSPYVPPPASSTHSHLHRSLSSSNPLPHPPQEQCDPSVSLPTQKPRLAHGQFAYATRSVW